MVSVAFLVDFIAVGFFFYSYGIFFKAIAVEFGDSRFGVSIGVTVTQGVGCTSTIYWTRAGQVSAEECHGLRGDIGGHWFRSARIGSDAAAVLPCTGYLRWFWCWCHGATCHV